MDINSLNNFKVEDRKIDISFKDATGREFEFDTLYKLRDFITSETYFWVDIEESLQPNQKIIIEEPVQGHMIRTAETPLAYLVINSGLHFRTLSKRFKNELLELVISERNSQENEVNLFLNSIGRSVQSSPYNKWVWSGHSFCTRGLKIFNELGTVAASSFFEAFLEKPNFTSLNTLEGFKGALLAYEFHMQDANFLGDRITLEEGSVNELKGNILEIKDNLYDDVLNSKNNFVEWFTEAEKTFKDQGIDQVNKFDRQFKTWSDKIVNLEKTYQEKLRLEPAASYWKTKAEDYKKLGNWWAIILSVFVAIGLGIFGFLFYTWVNAQATTISIDSLQGVVLFITVLSVYAFAIKALSKLAFSSYHLQRDAEEREQLTYLYLSLTHEKDDFDADARSIVLQALFSRADTGLISGDSSPTMPGVHEIINASSNK